MLSESEFTSFIQRRLDAVKIQSTLESTENVDITRALQTASKNFTGNYGKPDIIAVFEDYVLVMENKRDYDKLELKAGGNFVMDEKAVKNYAVNGAIFYARKILEGTRYTKIFAFGNAGDKKHHRFKPVYVDATTTKELPEVETFIDFTPENVKNYELQAVFGKETPEAVELKEIIKKAGELHEYLRNYGQLGETEKPLVVSAIILALDKNLNTAELHHEADESKNDGAKILALVENNLNDAQVKPEVKKARVLDSFRLIKNRPVLNNFNKKLEGSPLRAFAEYIKSNIYNKVKNFDKDYLGLFYREFVRYSGGDGQTLGVVLTPPHITELFCELVDLKVDDVVFDPCCGTGGFLLAAMNHMLKSATNDAQRDHIKRKQLHGIEIRDDMFSIATTSMILRGDGKSNLICEDFFAKDAAELQQSIGATVGFMNPPYSQAKNDATKHLSELRFIEHLLNSVKVGGRVAAIVPVSAMIGKTKDDKIIKSEILRRHTLKGVISLSKNTFYQIGVVPCIAVFDAGRPHRKGDKVKFINFEDDGFELKKHEGYVRTERAKDRKQYLLDCWNNNIADAPSNFMVEMNTTADDEWLHSFYYYNDELPAESDFLNTIADYLTFEFNMIVHGRGYLFDSVKKNSPPLIDVPPLQNKIWKEFVVGNLFDIFLPCGDTQADKCTDGKIPLISAGFNNNGVCKFINHGDDQSEIYDGNIISVDMFGKTFFHEYKFYSVSHGRINLLKSVQNLNQYHLQFLTVAINHSAREKFSYNQMCSSKRIKKLIIQLPVNAAGEPDFDYMEKYIALREAQLIKQYLEYISVPPPAEIVPLNEKIWRPFLIEDIFEIKSGRDIYEDERVAGDNPYIGASANNNGICHFVSNENETLEPKCISVNRNGSVGYAFYHPYAALYSNDCRKLRPKIDNEYISIFITAQITAQREKYNYGYKMGTGRLKRQKILLPINDAGEPDFAYMENFTKNQFAQLLKKYLAGKQE